MIKKLICIAHLALFTWAVVGQTEDEKAQGSGCVIHLFQPRSPFQVDRVIDRWLVKNGFSYSDITPALRQKLKGILVVDGFYSSSAAIELGNWLASKRQIAKDHELFDLLGAYGQTKRAHVPTHFNIGP